VDKKADFGAAVDDYEHGAVCHNTVAVSLNSVGFVECENSHSLTEKQRRRTGVTAQHICDEMILAFSSAAVLMSFAIDLQF